MTVPPPPDAACPKCGRPIPVGAPEHLCPACLVAMNLQTLTELTAYTGQPESPGSPSSTSPAPPPPPPPAPDAIGPLFPQLEILECLGRGGMGVVHRARQKSLDRLVALKLLAPERRQDPAFAERFQREARALARLSHPNIVTIHDFGQAGDFFYLLMEYVDGVNLRQLLQSRKLSPDEALAIVPPLCDALQYAHERGIVHRDIKPENLLLDREGRVKIADFGIAKLIEAQGASVAATAEVPGRSAADGSGHPAGPTSSSESSSASASLPAAGTPGYMAPEQKSAAHTVDRRADIYSLGVVFYEMLTGERPGGRLEPPSRKVQIDVRLDQIVLRALEQTPELRWQSAAELRTELAALTEPAPPPRLDRLDGTRPSTMPSAAGSVWPRSVLAGLLGFALVLSLVSIGLVRFPVTYQAQARLLLRWVETGFGNPAERLTAISDELLRKVATDLDLAGRWPDVPASEIPQRIRSRLTLHLAGNIATVQFDGPSAIETEELVEGLVQRLISESATADAAAAAANPQTGPVAAQTSIAMIQQAGGTAHPVRPNYRLIILMGIASGLLLGGFVAVWYGVHTRRRRRQQGSDPTARLTSAPGLALALTLAAFLIPLGAGSLFSTAMGIRYANEQRDHAQRSIRTQQARYLAQQRYLDLTRQLAAAKSAIPRADGNAAAELHRLTDATDAAATELRQAHLAVERASTRFHSRPVIDPSLFLLPAFLFAIPGSWLGFQHLQAIRGSTPPRHRQTIALIAALTWPLLVISTAVGAMVLLPLNHGTWAMLGLSLAVIAVVATDLWLVTRVGRWLGGTSWTAAFRLQPGQARWLPWLAGSFVLVLVLIAIRASPPARTPPSTELQPATLAPSVPPPAIDAPAVRGVPPPEAQSPAAAAEQRVLQAQYEKTLSDVMEAERELALLDTRTDLVPPARDTQTVSLQKRIKVFSEQRDSLRRRLELQAP